MVDDNELTDEALHLMKSKLPQYVVNCLVAAGFDTLKVLSMMDVSNNERNSISEVEEYVCKERPDCLPHGKFPPGHRIRIQMFVKEVQALVNPKVTLKGKGKSTTATVQQSVLWKI